MGNVELTDEQVDEFRKASDAIVASLCPAAASCVLLLLLLLQQPDAPPPTSHSSHRHSMLAQFDIMTASCIVMRTILQRMGVWVLCNLFGVISAARRAAAFSAALIGLGLPRTRSTLLSKHDIHLFLCRCSTSLTRTRAARCRRRR